MGCGGSSEAPVDEEAFADIAVHGEQEAGETVLEVNKVDLAVEEAQAVQAKPGDATFISSVLKARDKAAEDADVMLDCCVRLQAHNRRLKEYVAIYDCEAVNEAMNGGFLGMGCNDNKLIACLLTRTKAQLQRTKKTYRDKYDKDLRSEVEDETGGAYRKLMHFALCSPEQYIADIFDKACVGMGCDEQTLLEVFITHTQKELQAGKAKWEGRTDKSLVDYLNGELGRSYRHLNRLLQLLFMGDRVETDEVDEEFAVMQVGELKAECDKGWFEDFDESKIIEIIGANTIPQNQLVAQLYEKEHGESLAHGLKGKCGPKLYECLNGLLMPKAQYVAKRLHKAMEGWGTDRDVLTRLLGGLDGEKMQDVTQAFEDKYDQPLWSKLKEELGESSDFIKAAQTWISVLNNPMGGAEKFTELETAELEGDAAKLAEMLDWLLFEHENLHVFVAQLDIEVIREATKGSGHDDTALIRALATRNKRCLARVGIGYRGAYGNSLQALLESELGSKSKNEWYLYLAKFLVVQEEQADAMILDLAMAMKDGKVDHGALVEFACARHPKRVRAAKAKWEAAHDDSLVDLLADHLSGDMSRLMLKLLKGKRDRPSFKFNPAEARKQAHGLHDGEMDYVDVLATNNAKQNKMLAEEFENAYDTSLKRAIGQEFSGPVKEALLALMMGPADFYAMALKKALSGDEVDDKAVCRILGAADKEEVKAIAQAYDRKYNVMLKSAISSACRGNYKRLAVAWIDLSDQLAQPEKKVEFEKADAAPEEADEAKAIGSAQHVDDEISDEDDEPPSEHDPTTAMYGAKLRVWEQKFEKYSAMGKKSKAEHYQKLVLLYPPMPKGHKLLRGYLEALTEEYSKDVGGEDWTTLWFEGLGDADFDANGDGLSDGVDKAAFKKWMDSTETMIIQQLVSLKEMKGFWGLTEEDEKPKKLQREESEPVVAAVYAPNYNQQQMYMQQQQQQQQQQMMQQQMMQQQMMQQQMYRQQMYTQQQMMMQPQRMQQQPQVNVNVTVNAGRTVAQAVPDSDSDSCSAPFADSDSDSGSGSGSVSDDEEAGWGSEFSNQPFGDNAKVVTSKSMGDNIAIALYLNRNENRSYGAWIAPNVFVTDKSPFGKGNGTDIWGAVFCEDGAYTCFFKQDFSPPQHGFYLGGHASDGGKLHNTLKDAQKACLADSKAGGVTQEPNGKFTVRASSKLQASPAGETSWINNKKCPEIILPGGIPEIGTPDQIREARKELLKKVKKRATPLGAEWNLEEFL